MRGDGLSPYFFLLEAEDQIAGKVTGEQVGRVEHGLEVPACFGGLTHVMDALHEEESRFRAPFFLTEGTRLLDEWIGKTGDEVGHAPIVTKARP